MFGTGIFGHSVRVPDAETGVTAGRIVDQAAMGAQIPVSRDVPRQIPIVNHGLRSDTGGTIPIVSDQNRIMPINQVRPLDAPILRHTPRTNVGGQLPVQVHRMGYSGYSGLGAQTVHHGQQYQLPGSFVRTPGGFIRRPGFGATAIERGSYPGRYPLFPPQTWQMGPPTMSSFAGTRPDGLGGLIGIGGR